MNQIDKLIDALKMEQLEVNLFRGQNHDIGSSSVFGGQVLAQALGAAFATVSEDRLPHSLHAYFLLPGDLAAPIIYDVDRIRDGGSFTTRSVKAIQHGEAIFQLTVSFQLEQQSFEHQIPAPEVLPPSELVSYEGMAEQFGEQLPPKILQLLRVERPLEFKPVEFHNPFESEEYEPLRNTWLRAKGQVPHDYRLQVQLLAYASDYNLLTTALLPHGRATDYHNLQLASLDHAMWFHRPFDLSNWLLYTTDSPSASGARGFTRGHFFDEQGRLVASVVQEGLMRERVRK